MSNTLICAARFFTAAEILGTPANEPPETEVGRETGSVQTASFECNLAGRLQAQRRCRENWRALTNFDSYDNKNSNYSGHNHRAFSHI